MWLKKLLVILLLFSLALPLYSQSLAEASDEELLNELSILLTNLQTDNESLLTSNLEKSEELLTRKADLKEMGKLLKAQDLSLTELKMSLKSLEEEKAISEVTAFSVGLVVGAVVVIVFRLVQP